MTKTEPLPPFSAIGCLSLCLSLAFAAPASGQMEQSPPPAQASGEAPAAIEEQTGQEREAEQEAVDRENLAEAEAVTDEAPSTEVAETEMTAPATPEESSTELMPEEGDLIPLPEDITADADLLDLPMESGIADPGTLPDGDIPSMEIAPAMPAVPIGEPARILLARYKEVRTKMEKEADVVSLRAKADQAKTPEQSRAALREFYRLLFQKIRKADPSLSKRCDAMEHAYLERLSQNRVEPTIPLEPPPVPEPLPSPTR